MKGTTQEYFDICDENGQPIGKTVERTVAHQEGVPHRTAHVWITRMQNGRRQILLQKRSMNKDSFPGMYDTSSAGHVPAGDEPDVSAARELEEELGLSAKPGQLKYAGFFHAQYELPFHGKMFRDNEYVSVYVYDAPVKTEDIRIQQDELEAVEWFDLEEVYRDCKEGVRDRFCVPTEGLDILIQFLNANAQDPQFRKYQIDTEENRRFLSEIREELLCFGQKFPSPAGSSYYLGDDGTPWKDRPRETWITSRMAYVYSLGMLLKRGEKTEPSCGLTFGKCRELAECALQGLEGELKDQKNGGWYAGITADGQVIPGKQCYAHAFVILAASTAYLAGIQRAEPLLQEALSVYDRFFWDDTEGLAADTWDTEFKKLDAYRGLNANMHSVEAFLAVYDALKDPVYLERAGRIIQHVVKWSEKNNWRIPEHYTADWMPDLECNCDKPQDPFKPYGATPGHGIEWARLILQWTAAGGTDGSSDADETDYAAIAQHLYQRAIDDAWNCDGSPGIVYTTDWNGKPVVHDRMHWTLAEAINSSAVLYRTTQQERYKADYAVFMEYLDQKVLDHKNGSWFHQMDQNNQVTGTVWPGKSDLYHAVQATLIPYSLQIGTSIGAALKADQLYYGCFRGLSAIEPAGIMKEENRMVL